MKPITNTIKITRQGFASSCMNYVLSYFKRCLGMHYNVIVDPYDPDIVIHSSLYHGSEPDSWLTMELGIPTPQISYDPATHPSKKFLFYSGEWADCIGSVRLPNMWGICNAPVEHSRYLQQASVAQDIWAIYDEAMITDEPTQWLLSRDYELISKRNVRFCSVVQASKPPHRIAAYEELCKYKQIDGAGGFANNINESESGVNRDAFKQIYRNRPDGISIRQKILFESNYKFSLAIQFVCVPHLIVEKIAHAFCAGTIPIFWGNPKILEFGWNPKAFINLHDYESEVGNWMTIDWGAVRSRIASIDTDESIRRKMIEEPIFVDNRLPEQLSMRRVADFLQRMVESKD